MPPIQFDLSFNAQPGEPIEVARDIVRLTANNAGPMTFKGTNSYLVGKDTVIVVDPGPMDALHLQNLMRVIDGRDVDAILVTHSHKDHSPLSRPLKAKTNAPILGAGPHAFWRPFQPGDVAVDAAADLDYLPDTTLAHGQRMQFGGHGFETVATPGHTRNHLCFALPDQGILLSGDHVMAWSSTLVAPPDGAMTPYLESLERLIARNELCYLPGHGNILDHGKAQAQALLDHRLEREAMVMDHVNRQVTTINDLVVELYAGLDARLHTAAGLSVLAHLERLKELGLAQEDSANATWSSVC